MPSCAFIVPLRDFDTAKSRLSGSLSQADRHALAALCAERVLDRRVECRRIVVCDSDAVESWSLAHGVETIRVSSTGLNEALTEAMPIVLGEDPDLDVVIAHGDIVDPDGLDGLVAGVRDLEPGRPEPQVVLVPDRRLDGTNAIRLDRSVVRQWRFQYGPGSFERHEQQALTHGWRTFVHRDGGLSLDVDTPEDLLHPLVRTFVRTHFPHLDLPDSGTP